MGGIRLCGGSEGVSVGGGTGWVDETLIILRIKNER